MFQSTHPHGVRHRKPVLQRHFLYPCFNPRTHTGCDRYFFQDKGRRPVSIHAPTRGATRPALFFSGQRAFQSTHPHGVRPFSPASNKQICIVSIHAPTRGATYSCVVSPSGSRFQSTHPHGVRRNCGSACKRSTSFNPRTHTGCDMDVLRLAFRQGVSIHAPTRGATTTQIYAKITKEFQSTHPHGVRPLINGILSRTKFSFNPRTHTGCDII